VIHLHNIDCMEAMAKMPHNAFDLAIVDPPYGIKWCQNANNWIRSDGTRKPRKKWKNPTVKTYTQKNWDDQRPTQKYFDELFRVSQKVVIFGGNYFADILPPSGGWLVWDKDIPETLSFSMGELAYLNFQNTVDIVKKCWSGFRRCEVVNRIHPTQKPVMLYSWILNKYAKKGWRILDTHLGSGSSAIACYDMGFYFEGYEIDKDYYNAAKQRLDYHKRQQRMFV
jgi:site-specific DNA-methyltransferase (adenine-specific)